MKKQVLIFLSTIVFTLLFYNQEMGVNLSIFALILLMIQFVLRPDLIRDKKAVILGGCVILTSFSHAWLLSFTTVVSVVCSSFVFRFYVVDPKMKLVTQMFAYLINWPAFIGQVFFVDTWFEFNRKDSKETFAKAFSYIVLPFLILSVFFIIYVSSSDWISTWYDRYKWNVDGLIVFVLFLGFYVSFVFWHAKIYPILKAIDRKLLQNYSFHQQTELRPTFNFVPLEFEMRSGIITLVSLNMMLLLFLTVFNLENAQQSVQQVSEYSSRTHDQIYLIIGSVVLAMLVVLFFFKGALNFIKKNEWLLRLTKLWIGLNGMLIISAFYQNSIYISELGLTYKRLGVYAFLTVCGLGLFFSFKKIQLKRTNFYLIDKMSWIVYGTLIFCSIFNWSSLITKYNLKQHTVDVDYLETELTGNEQLLIDYYGKKGSKIPDRILERIKQHQKASFLSSQLYYKNIQVK